MDATSLIHHYPPEVFQLLVDVIPKLCKYKKDLLNFFRGAGVDRQVLFKYENLLHRNPNEFGSKYNAAREILTILNDRGEASLRERREIIKRVVEFEDFSRCWDNERAVAEGLVTRLQKIVNQKDSFTRMNIEREKERDQRLEDIRKQQEKAKLKKESLRKVKDDLFALFSPACDPHKRGKALEGILNRFFELSGILVKEAFTVTGTNGQGITEQIDGAIEIDGLLYLTEMKWWHTSIGQPELSQHIIKAYHRPETTHAIYISYSAYTEPAIQVARDAIIKGKMCILCTLQEVVQLLSNEKDVKEWLKYKINAARMDKNPFYIPSF